MIKTAGLVTRLSRCQFYGPVFTVRRCRRFLATQSQDPKYVFSKPPSPSTVQRKTSEGGINDGKHFFTPPKGNPKNSSEEDGNVNIIGQVIAQQRSKRRRQLISAILVGVIGTILGYSVGYKVLYLREQSFIPLFPASTIRKLSERDRRAIDIKRVEDLSRIRVLEQLSQHEMIKEQYGVPLHDADTNETPKVQDFSIWGEDQDPCVTGLVIEPDDGRPSTHSWYRIPFLVKWRLTHRPISISRAINNLLQGIGLSTTDLFQVIAPEKVYGSFKYEYPLPGDDHSMHIWFLGEMKLNNESLVVYKGKFHVDVKLQEIDLLRKENDELVRYILYKDGGK